MDKFLMVCYLARFLKLQIITVITIPVMSVRPKKHPIVMANPEQLRMYAELE